jgi:hypothetical protein
MLASPQALGGRLVMKFLLSGLGLALIATWVTPAEAQSVNCPLTTANRQITNPLPPEWRQTAFAQRLTGTRKTTSGVLQTLICEYGEAGNIERAAPDNTVCTARTGGFDCRPTLITRALPQTATISRYDVYKAGTVTLRSSTGPGQAIDLDTGGNSQSGGEIKNITYEARGWGYDYAISGPGGMWLHRGTEPLGKAGCTKSVDQFRSVPVGFLPPVGQHACYKTGAGRIGEFVVTAYGTAPGGVQTVTIKFTTWN